MTRVWTSVLPWVAAAAVLGGLWLVQGALDLSSQPFIFAFMYFVALVGFPIVAFLIANRSPRPAIFLAVRIVLALLIGIGGIYPLGKLFDAMEWPIFHTWGLGHGSFVIAIPVLVWLAYVGLGYGFRKASRHERAT